MVGSPCLSVEAGLVEVVTPGMSMVLSGTREVAWVERDFSRYAFLIFHLSLNVIINVCV